jgi:hypothetical protein
MCISCSVRRMSTCEGMSGTSGRVLRVIRTPKPSFTYQLIPGNATQTRIMNCQKRWTYRPSHGILFKPHGSPRFATTNSNTPIALSPHTTVRVNYSRLIFGRRAKVQIGHFGKRCIRWKDTPYIIIRRDNEDMLTVIHAACSSCYLLHLSINLYLSTSSTIRKFQRDISP